jgi:hypothetical protein
MCCIRKSKGFWIARLMIEYKYIIIGKFRTETDAINAYNKFILEKNLNRKIKI